MRFTNEDHLTVHLKKHEMCLALNSGNNSRTSNNLFLDQTPTPTKFLKNCEEIGLFQDLTKNPFEEAFKKASETGGPDGSSDSVPLPGPHSNEVLHTPVVSRPHKTVETLKLENEEIEIQVVDESSNEATSRSCVIQHQLEGKRPSHGSSMATPPPPASASATSSATHSLPQPTSTTSDDDGVIMSTIQHADSSVPSTDSATISSAGSTPSVIQSSSAPILSPNMISSTQYTMQVYLQLPTGQTVPVQIPATITNSAMPMASIPVPTISPKSSSSATVATAAAVAATSSSSGLSQPSLAKQKLKAALQSSQNVPQDLTTSNNSRLVDSANHISQMASPSPSSISVKTETASIASDATASSPESLDAAIICGGVIKRPKRSGEDDPDERRRKFLERNRAAAARCRQKRKQWITNLEKKAEELQNTNSRLQSEVNLLRTEVAQLKSLLLAHKDCPITLQQKSMGQLSIQAVPMTGESANIIITSTAISTGAEHLVPANLTNAIASSSSNAPVSSSTPSTNFNTGGIATTMVTDRSHGNSINSKNSNSLRSDATILASPK